MYFYKLGPGDELDIIDCLIDSFKEYPVMKYILNRELDFQQHLYALIKYYTVKRLRHNWPVIGCKVDNKLVGVSLISLPGIGDKEILQYLALQLEKEIGRESYARHMFFENASDKMMPEGNFLFIGMLGVRNEYQGVGIGKALLKRTKELAIEGTYDGICLTTEDPKNINYYQKHGYEVIGTTELPGLQTWGFKYDIN